LELGWYIQEMAVSYLACERCGKKECYMEKNREQGVISNRKLEEME